MNATGAAQAFPQKEGSACSRFKSAMLDFYASADRFVDSEFVCNESLVPRDYGRSTNHKDRVLYQQYAAVASC